MGKKRKGGGGGDSGAAAGGGERNFELARQRGKELFDAIFINGSVDLVPQSINEQRRDGGRVVTIKREGQIGNMAIFKKAGDYMNQINHFEVTVPYISKDFIRKSEFAF